MHDAGRMFFFCQVKQHYGVVSKGKAQRVFAEEVNCTELTIRLRNIVISIRKDRTLCLLIESKRRNDCVFCLYRVLISLCSLLIQVHFLSFVTLVTHLQPVQHTYTQVPSDTQTPLFGKKNPSKKF